MLECTLVGMRTFTKNRAGAQRDALQARMDKKKAAMSARQAQKLDAIGVSDEAKVMLQSQTQSQAMAMNDMVQAMKSRKEIAALQELHEKEILLLRQSQEEERMKRKAEMAAMQKKFAELQVGVSHLLVQQQALPHILLIGYGVCWVRLCLGAAAGRDREPCPSKAGRPSERGGV
jgi:hypothetical protein